MKLAEGNPKFQAGIKVIYDLEKEVLNKGIVNAYERYYDIVKTEEEKEIEKIIPKASAKNKVASAENKKINNAKRLEKTKKISNLVREK
ncbi:MAG: hypothetical protein ACI4R8_02265 [Candidatus Caccovivens sp.]